MLFKNAEMIIVRHHR